MSLNHPSQRNPAKYGTYKVAFANGPSDFPSEQRAWVGLGVNACEALGPEFVWVNDPKEADFLFAHWLDADAESVRSPGRTTFVYGKRPLSEIDPASCKGERAFRTAVAHELMSALRCEHVRHDASEGAVDDAGAPFSPVGHGIAVMNQRVTYGADPEITTESYEGRVAVQDPTALDVAEFNRVYEAGLVPRPRS